MAVRLRCEAFGGLKVSLPRLLRHSYVFMPDLCVNGKDYDQCPEGSILSCLFASDLQWQRWNVLEKVGQLSATGSARALRCRSITCICFAQSGSRDMLTGSYARCPSLYKFNDMSIGEKQDLYFGVNASAFDFRSRGVRNSSGTGRS